MAIVRVLVVDDEAFNRQYLRICLEAAGFELDEASDGAEAWDILQQRPKDYDAILLDRRMPEMDGMQVLEKLKADQVLRHIPVIMQTALDREQDIIEAMQAGVYYYLTKPYDGQVLVSVVRSATDEFARHQRLEVEVAKRAGAIGLMTQGRFVLQTPKEADALAILLGSGFERSAAVAMGLSELLINAIEHGNLELDYASKTDLIAEGQWDTVIAARLNEQAFRNRRVVVEIAKDEVATTFTITDEGKGFDWRSYVDLTMDRVFDTHGRGIAMAKKLAFASLEYKGKGNVVEACVAHPITVHKPQPVAVEAESSKLVCVIDPDRRLSSVIDVVSGITDVSVTNATGNNSETAADLWIVDANNPDSVEASTKVNRDRLLFVGEGWENKTDAVDKKLDGSLALPIDSLLIEAVTRSFLVPETMEIGAEIDQSLSPSLASHQMELLPDVGLLSTSHWKISSCFEGCTPVSGDLWGARILDDARVEIFFADFTGHGPVAGARSFQLQDMMKQLPLQGLGPSQVMKRMNACLHRVLPTSQYAAMLYGIIDVVDNTFTYAGGGTPPPLIVEDGYRDIRIGDGKGLPLGVSPDFTYVERELHIGNGDSLILLTDGMLNVVEGGNPGVEALDKFCAIFSDGDRQTSPDKLLSRQFNEAPRPLADDVLTICLTVTS